MILDGLRRPDDFVSAGSIPIKKLMNGTDPLADWLIKFGAPEMVIAYSPDSRFYNDLEKSSYRTSSMVQSAIQSKSQIRENQSKSLIQKGTVCHSCRVC